jgi:2-(1,2-epoxy-1,2-dihydrophenyl)acetyl-CoA isomerase
LEKKMKEVMPVTVTRDGPVAIVRLSNDENRNSMTQAMRDALAGAFLALDADVDCRAVYLTGSGKSFCAGGDLPMLKNEMDPWSTHARFNRTAQLIRFRKPIVVGVNGFAVGGGFGLSLVGDTLIAAQSATFMAGFFRLGVIPDIGVMYNLPRLIGLARARTFIFENRSWTGQEAVDNGVAATVVPDDRLDEECMKRAHAFASGPIETMGLAKWLMGRTFETSIDDMMAFENLGQSLAFTSEAFKEGLNALSTKNKPDFAAASDREPFVKAARARRNAK